MEDVKARTCNSEQCEDLTTYLIREPIREPTLISSCKEEQEEELKCGRCGSSQVVRTGFDNTKTGKKQKFKCKGCHAYWREGSQEKTERRKVLIEYAKERVSKTSLRAIAGEILEKYQLKVSHVAIAKWLNKPRSSDTAMVKPTTRETMSGMLASGNMVFVDESELPMLLRKHGHSRGSVWRKRFADIPAGKALVIEGSQSRLSSISGQLRYFHNHDEFPNLTARQVSTDKTRLYIINHIHAAIELGT